VPNSSGDHKTGDPNSEDAGVDAVVYRDVSARHETPNAAQMIAYRANGQRYGLRIYVTTMTATPARHAPEKN
jgi:hypothetical protein